MTRDRVPDQVLQYLKDKKKLYDMYAVLWNFKIIDGSKDKEVLQNVLCLYRSKKLPACRCHGYRYDNIPLRSNELFLLSLWYFKPNPGGLANLFFFLKSFNLFPVQDNIFQKHMLRPSPDDPIF